MLEIIAELTGNMTRLFANIRSRLDSKLDKTANAVSASKLKDPFTISLSGDYATGQVSTDGSGNVALPLVLKDTGVAANIYGSPSFNLQITVNTKGQITAITPVAPLPASLTQSGVSRLNSATNSTVEDQAATPLAVKTAYDLASQAKTTADGAVPKTSVGVASGVAGLDASGKVPTAQLPPASDLPNQGLFSGYNFNDHPAVAQAIPRDILNSGLRIGRCKGNLVGFTGPVGNADGLLKIYALSADETGTTPYYGVRREFSSYTASAGMVDYVQYAVDGNTWSAWKQLPKTDAAGKFPIAVIPADATKLNVAGGSANGPLVATTFGDKIWVWNRNKDQGNNNSVAINIDFTQYSVYEVNMTGSHPVAFATLPVGTWPALANIGGGGVWTSTHWCATLRLRQNDTVAGTITWPTGIKWMTATGNAPTLPELGKTIEIILSTYDGTNWVGRPGRTDY